MKKIIYALAVILAAASANAQELTLEDRRAVESFKTQNFPALDKQIDEAAGYDVDVQVDWDKLGVNNSAKEFEGDATRLYFTPLIGALKTIAADDMGKKALRAKLKKVIITDSKHYIDPSHFEFKDGVLTLDHRFLNAHNPESRQKKIVEVLNAGL